MCCSDRLSSQLTSERKRRDVEHDSLISSRQRLARHHRFVFHHVVGVAGRRSDLRRPSSLRCGFWTEAAVGRCHAVGEPLCPCLRLRIDRTPVTCGGCSAHVHWRGCPRHTVHWALWLSTGASRYAGSTHSVGLGPTLVSSWRPSHMPCSSAKGPARVLVLAKPFREWGQSSPCSAELGLWGTSGRTWRFSFSPFRLLLPS
jgi:hypothetical protein